MGIFDFLGDLSSKRSRELGLGGLQSLLGTRGAAQAGAIGDEMIGITNQDSLPGYFNEQTREYVPWYVDLFDGGGLNAAGGQAEQAAAQSGAMGVTPGGAPVQSSGLLQTRLGGQLSDMEMANRNRVGQMAPSLGGQLSDMEMANRNRASQVARNDAIYSARVQETNRGAANAMSNYNDPRLKTESTGYSRSPYITDNFTRKTDLGAAGYGPMGQAMPAPAPTQQGTQVIPASGGNMAINTPAAQNRDQMIANQQMYNEEEAMKSHPLYQEYVDFLNRSKMPSTPSLFQQYINTFGNM